MELTVAVVAVGVGLGTLTATLGGMISRGQGTLARAIESNREEIADLREGTARLEGLFEGHLMLCKPLEIGQTDLSLQRASSILERQLTPRW